MTYADTLEAKVIELKDNAVAEIQPFVDPNKIFAFRVGPLNLSRWTRVNIGISLPREPLVGFAQVKFPGTTALTVSDNFACTVAILSRSQFQVNVWRVDSGADPSINYHLDCLLITR